MGLAADASPAPWQIALARLEGALPFLNETIAQALAQRSLRRLWTVHIRDYPFENIGLEHNPGLEAGELMRSWYAEERRDLLSWVSRRGPPPLPVLRTLGKSRWRASKGRCHFCPRP